MFDRVFGIFDDTQAANEAAARLTDKGLDRGRLTVKRVLKPGHRGVTGTGAATVYSLIHAPEIKEGDHADEGAGTVLLVVDMVEPQEDVETGSDSFDPFSNDAVITELERLGATETHVVEGTPGLDL